MRTLLQFRWGSSCRLRVPVVNAFRTESIEQPTPPVGREFHRAVLEKIAGPYLDLLFATILWPTNRSIAEERHGGSSRKVAGIVDNV